MPVTLHFGEDIQNTMDDPRCDWSGGTLDTLEDVLRQCPQTVFLAHAPGFWEYFRDPADPAGDGRIARMLRRYPNLYCDISAGSGLRALAADAEYTVKFIVEFQDRILYGRDCFHNQHQEFLNSLMLPESIAEKIYSGNAEKLLH